MRLKQHLLHLLTTRQQRDLLFLATCVSPQSLPSFHQPTSMVSIVASCCTGLQVILALELKHKLKKLEFSQSAAVNNQSLATEGLILARNCNKLLYCRFQLLIHHNLCPRSVSWLYHQMQTATLKIWTLGRPDSFTHSCQALSSSNNKSWSHCSKMETKP